MPLGLARWLKAKTLVSPVCCLLFALKAVALGLSLISPSIDNKFERQLTDALPEARARQHVYAQSSNPEYLLHSLGVLPPLNQL